VKIAKSPAPQRQKIDQMPLIRAIGIGSGTI
jgi:hypothetical protein